MEKIFYKLKMLKKAKEKINFVKFVPKRSAPKWTSNKTGNAKKGHNISLLITSPPSVSKSDHKF